MIFTGDERQLSPEEPSDRRLSPRSEEDPRAREGYERLVMAWEVRTGKHGVRWEYLSHAEQEYWAKIWYALREVGEEPPT